MTSLSALQLYFKECHITDPVIQKVLLVYICHTQTQMYKEIKALLMVAKHGRPSKWQGTNKTFTLTREYYTAVNSEAELLYMEHMCMEQSPR